MRVLFSHRVLTGVASVASAQGHGGNVIYGRLRDRGYPVFAVNPNADGVEGDPCFQTLHAIPGGVDAVVLATRPEEDATTLQECVELGVKQAWMHRSFGAGSVSEEAAAWARERGVTVIDGGCPLMFNPTADGGLKALRHLCK